MKSKIVIFLLSAIFLSINMSCGDKYGNKLGGDHIIPYVQIYTEIPFGTGGDDPLSWQNIARYFATSTPNPTAIGYKGHGIIVFTSDLEDFHCYDATCTNCSDLESFITAKDLKGTTAVCPVCGMEFELFSGQAITNTEKIYPLKSYSITKVGKKLIVRN